MRRPAPLPLPLRLNTALAIVPAVAVLFYAGEGGVLQLLVLSQVVLILQMAVAIVPLIRFTSAARISAPTNEADDNVPTHSVPMPQPAAR